MHLEGLLVLRTVSSIARSLIVWLYVVHDFTRIYESMASQILYFTAGYHSSSEVGDLQGCRSSRSTFVHLDILTWNLI
jgi:hypothetical protein